MEKETFLNKYWNYYLLLEMKVIDLEKYIEFEEDNLKVYSFEIQSKLMMICCEIEAMYKLIVGDRKNNVKEYIDEILNKTEYKDLVKDKIQMIDFGKMSFYPIKLATNKMKNGWWDAYNCLKHNKFENDNYKKANLENLLYALGTLYILEIRFYNNNFYNKEEDEDNIPNKESKIFQASDLKANFISNLEARIIEEW